MLAGLRPVFSAAVLTGYLLLVELVQPVGTLLLIVWDVLHVKAPGRETVKRFRMETLERH